MKEEEKYGYENTFFFVFSIWFDSNKEAFRVLHRIVFNDCLLRHRHQFNFITVFDVDELPVLLQHDSLPAFIEDEFEKWVTVPNCTYVESRNTTKLTKKHDKTELVHKSYSILHQKQERKTKDTNIICPKSISYD
mgnify:CR=1 FL=1